MCSGALRLGLDVLGLHGLTGSELAPWEKAGEQEARQRAAQTQPAKASGNLILPFPMSQETPASVQRTFKSIIMC